LKLEPINSGILSRLQHQVIKSIQNGINMDKLKDTLLLCYKSVLELVPIETVCDQIIAEIDGH